MSKICEECGKNIDENTYTCPECNSAQIETMKSEIKDVSSKFIGKINKSLHKAKDLLSDTTELTDEKIVIGKDKFLEFLEKNPQISEEYEKHLDNITERYESSGAKGYVNSAKETSSEKFDIISGKKMYQLVKDKLTLQDRYNDLLATKLHETIAKLKNLEDRISEIEKNKK